jgi:hypothetical protein
MIEKNHWIALIPLLVANIAFIYIGMSHDIVELTAENGVMEYGQGLLLALSMIAFLLPLSTATPRQRYVLFACSLFCFSSVLRELDVEDYDIPQLFIILGSGIGKKIVLAVLWAPILIYFARNFSYYKTTFSDYLFSKTGRYILLGGVVMFLGWPFDKGLVDSAYNNLYEELFEFSGYYFLLVAAIVAPASLRVIAEIEESK